MVSRFLASGQREGLPLSWHDNLSRASTMGATMRLAAVRHWQSQWHQWHPITTRRVVPLCVWRQETQIERLLPYGHVVQQADRVQLVGKLLPALWIHAAQHRHIRAWRLAEWSD